MREAHSPRHATDTETGEHAADDKSGDGGATGLRSDANAEQDQPEDDGIAATKEVTRGRGEESCRSGSELVSRSGTARRQDEHSPPKKVPADRIEVTSESLEVVSSYWPGEPSTGVPKTSSHAGISFVPEM